MNLENSIAADVAELAERLRELERMQHQLWVFDLDNARVLWSNESALQVWQSDSKEELYSRDMGTDMSLSVSKRLNQYRTDFAIDENAQFKEIWTLHPVGEPITLNVVFSAFKLRSGRLCIFCEAVAEKTVDAETLRSSEALLHTSVHISLYSTMGQPLYRNPASRSMVTSSNHTLQDHFADPDLLCQFKDSTKHEIKAITSVNTVNGVVWHDITARRCNDAVSGEAAWLISEVDISKLKETEEHAQFLAEHDTLTKLPNRNYVSTYFQQKINETLAKGNTGGLIFIDLDNFKHVNDSLGHDAGDQLLVEVATRLRSIEKSEYSIARLGGDEFLMLINPVQSDHHFESIMQQIISVVSAPISLHGGVVQATPSIGIALYPNDGTQILELMRHADLAMYHAKETGKNNFAYFSKELSEAAETKMNIVSELRVALKDNQFETYFQPRLDVSSNSIVGAEALVRWNHPTRGMVPPAEFIAVCEESGLISELGKIVFQQAIVAQRTWTKQGYDIRISVNLSPLQFNEENLVSELLEIVKEQNGNPKKIELEITESVLLGHDQGTINKLHQFVSAGFDIAIDDFGTGYSNLAYLHRYPISCLKIDRSFVNSMDSAKPIIELIVSMAKLFNLYVVAEGVETPEQLESLQNFYCQEYQGYLFHKPTDFNNFSVLLNLNSVKTAA